LEMSRYASRETHRKPPRITRVHEAAQPVFWEISRFSEITRTVSREFPWHTVPESSMSFSTRKNFPWDTHPISGKF
jgi:hypothetical protein